MTTPYQIISKRILFILLFLCTCTFINAKDGKSTSTLEKRFYECFSNRDFEQSVSIGNHIYEQWRAPKDTTYTDFLFHWGVSTIETHDYLKALEIFSEYEETITTFKLFDGEEFSLMLEQRIMCLMMLGRQKEAIELFDKKVAFDIEFSEDPLSLALSLMDESLIEIINKNNTIITSKLKQIEAYTIMLELSDLDEESRREYLIRLADSYKDIRLTGRAKEIYGDVLKEYKQSISEAEQIELLSGLATCDYLDGDFNAAISKYDDVIRLVTTTISRNPSNKDLWVLDYASSLICKSLCLMGMTDFYSSIDLLSQAMELFDEIDIHGSAYISCLNNLAICYFNLGEISKAMMTYEQIKSLQTDTGVTNQALMVFIDIQMANCYIALGDNEKAKHLLESALPVVQSSENINAYYSCLNNYLLINPGNDGFAMMQKIYDYQKEMMGKNHPATLRTYMNLAVLSLMKGNYLEAKHILNEILSTQEKILSRNNLEYAATLENISACEILEGNFATALSIEEDVLRIRQQLLHNQNYLIAKAYYSIAMCQWLLNDKEAALNTFEIFANMQQQLLLSTLSSINTTQRNSFWSKSSEQFQEILPQVSFSKGIIKDTHLLYDKSCLFAKGLLLTAETDMRKLILESGDVEAVKKFEQLQTTRAWLNKLYEKPIAERHVSTDSLENVAEKLEMELVHMSKTYGDFMHNLKLTWKDVQDKLSDKDVAVEFLSFPVLNSDSTMYIALTVRKGYDAPHMVTLFEENELKSIKSSYYESSELSKLVWGKMADELEGVENIYFSPSGELYNIAIESMPHWSNSGMMGDRFNLYRLSSTRELAINRSETKSSGAVVYGGIVYKTDVANMGAPRTDKEYLYTYRGFDPDSTNCRGTNWKYLYGTLLEANDIVAILKNNNIPVDSLTGIDATESSLKDLSGQKKRILHISTHGFYWSESAAESKYERDKLRFLQMGDDRPRYIEDKAMTRSGLLFAGAQNTFDGVEIPAGVEDGVLTAQEISNLDLRGLDLLTLSACQTGLGEIKGDGVFGLQRGFKKAGARSILMSLWKVDDLSSRLFMTEFYRNFISGKSKQESFKLAQKFIGEYKDENGVLLFNDPSYWASFILLDALD